MADSRAGAERIQDGLEYTVVLESKEVLKTKNGSMSQGHRSQPEGGLNGQSWNNLSHRISNAVLDYNPKHTVNTHVSTII